MCRIRALEGEIEAARAARRTLLDREASAAQRSEELRASLKQHEDRVVRQEGQLALLRPRARDTASSVDSAKRKLADMEARVDMLKKSGWNLKVKLSMHSQSAGRSSRDAECQT